MYALMCVEGRREGKRERGLCNSMAAKANAKHRQDCGGKGGMDGAGDRVYHTK